MPTRMEKVKDDKGNLSYVMLDGTDEILIDVDDYKEAKSMKLTDTVIRYQARKGKRQFKNYIRKYEQRQSVERLTAEDREREERRRDKLDAKQRKEQERLQMIEKHRVSSKWFKHLCENDIFPKVVKQMKIRDLDIGYTVWFIKPGKTLSEYGTVKELIYNDGEPQAVIEMGEFTKVIDDTYDIAIGSGYDVNETSI